MLDPALAGVETRAWAIAFWHGQQFGILRWAVGWRRPIVALVSLSADGQLLASAFGPLGIFVERGSSSLGGAAGLKAIVRRMRRGLVGAFAVDGPRGPARVVRSESGGVGAALATRLSGGVVVPVASACSRVHRFARAWDGFELPLPFSRVAVVLGAPMTPAEATPEALAIAIDTARAAAEQLVHAESRA